MIPRRTSSLKTRASFYNVAVPEQQDSRRIMRAETIGVLIIALVILVVILVRWGGLIPWSAR